MLQQALLQLLLARDTVTRPRHRFQAFGIDLRAAGDALSEAAFANAVERGIHHLQELTLGIALVKQEFLVI